MSSFLDRWIYRDNRYTHNMGTMNGNTGSKYTQTSSLASHDMFTPNYTAGNPASSEKTTPNLRNVPWSYYTELNTSRRGSSSSTGSTSSTE